MTVEEYQNISDEEYKTQYFLGSQLKEWTKTLYLNTPKVGDTINELLRLGVYMQKDEETGYIIRPIIGNGHWDKEQWEKFTSSVMNDNELLKTIEEVLKRLAVNDNNYISVAEPKHPAQIESYEEYREQEWLKIRLTETLKVERIVPRRLVEIIRDLCNTGMYLRRDAKHGYRMEQLTGYDTEKWGKLTEEIKRYREMRDKLIYRLKFLSEVEGRPMMSKSCACVSGCKTKITPDCFVSDCRYAARLFETITKRKWGQYESKAGNTDRTNTATAGASDA